VSAYILVIDDDSASRDLAAYLLRAAGYDVATAADGGEGIREALATPPAMVLCDLDLPVCDGFAVLRALRASPRLHGLPVVALTASSMTGDRESTLAAGFDGYLSKPVVPEQFAVQVGAFLAPSAPRSPPRQG